MSTSTSTAVSLERPVRSSPRMLLAMLAASTCTLLVGIAWLSYDVSIRGFSVCDAAGCVQAKLQPFSFVPRELVATDATGSGMTVRFDESGRLQEVGGRQKGLKEGCWYSWPDGTPTASIYRAGQAAVDVEHCGPPPGRIVPPRAPTLYAPGFEAFEIGGRDGVWEIQLQSVSDDDQAPMIRSAIIDSAATLSDCLTEWLQIEFFLSWVIDGDGRIAVLQPAQDGGAYETPAAVKARAMRCFERGIRGTRIRSTGRLILVEARVLTGNGINGKHSASFLSNPPADIAIDSSGMRGRRSPERVRVGYGSHIVQFQTDDGRKLERRFRIEDHDVTVSVDFSQGAKPAIGPAKKADVERTP